MEMYTQTMVTLKVFGEKLKSTPENQETGSERSLQLPVAKMIVVPCRQCMLLQTLAQGFKRPRPVQGWNGRPAVEI